MLIEFMATDGQRFYLESTKIEALRAVGDLVSIYVTGRAEPWLTRGDIHGIRAEIDKETRYMLR